MKYLLQLNSSSTRGSGGGVLAIKIENTMFRNNNTSIIFCCNNLFSNSGGCSVYCICFSPFAIGNIVSNNSNDSFTSLVVIIMLWIPYLQHIVFRFLSAVTRNDNTTCFTTMIRSITFDPSSLAFSLRQVHGHRGIKSLLYVEFCPCVKWYILAMWWRWW